jgi:4-carboxymuconolactone decarboxylase
LARVPYLDRDDLPADRQHVFDRIAESRGSVGNVFRALLNSPDAAEVVAAVGEYVRYRSSLDPAIREIAVLSTAQEHGNEYEWAHHESVAREAGVRDEVIEAIRSGRAPMGLPAKEGVFAQAARELVRDGTMSDRTFQAVEHLLGRQTTVDLIVTVGYYTMLSRVMTALGVELEEETGT